MITSGIYSWTYGGGQFTVCLRPSGVFYCSEYPAVATWEGITDEGDQKLLINWKNFGKYELKVISEGVLEGYQVGKPNNWRKMQFLRPFNDVETLMIGAGGKLFVCTSYVFSIRFSFPVRFHKFSLLIMM
jgi:hypothetical protein